MARRCVLLIWALLFLMNVPSAQLQDMGDRCLQPPYPEPTGLQAGGRGQVLPGNYFLNVQESPENGEIIGSLKPQETFVVLEGPTCWYVQPTSNNRQEWRGWRVRSEQQNLEGWIPDYTWFFVGGNVYWVKPLADNEAATVVGDAIAEPITLSGDLQWTGLNGPLEPRQDVHTVHFDAPGYITIDVQTNLPEFTQPHSVCWLVLTLVPVEGRFWVTASPIWMVGNDLQWHGQQLNQLWVEAGNYRFEVQQTINTNALPAKNLKLEDVTCPEATYTVTLKPALASRLNSGCTYSPYPMTVPFPVYPTEDRSGDRRPIASVAFGASYPAIGRSDQRYQIVLTDELRGWVNQATGDLHGACDALPTPPG